MKNEFSELTTESSNPLTENMDKMNIEEQLLIMNSEDRKVAIAVQRELESIKSVILACIKCFSSGGRIIYCGAGTSGRIGVLDAVESLPTFNVDENKIIAVLAGNGMDGERAEDSFELGKKDITNLNVKQGDIVIGLAASGRTPYVIGSLETAKNLGAETASICCNKNSLVSKYASNPVEIDCGPEVLTGSTRLKAGTAQKMVLNMISTITMINCGKTYKNLMVDVVASNKKLMERWKKIVTQASGCSNQEADELYQKSNGSAKIAIIMYISRCDRAQASIKLKESNGFVSKAIKEIK